jgi:C1A family cysteine protease
MAKRDFFAGWKRQEPDYRDFHYVVPRTMTAQLPPKADLSANMPPQLDQGELGACGPNSLDECAEYDEKVQGLKVNSASRLFIYWVTRSLMPGKPTDEDSGVDNRTMLKAVAKYGFCNETLWPYKVAKFSHKPPQSCFTAARKNRIKSYAAVQQNLAQMKGCIASGFPFLFGFDVYESFMTDAVAKTGIVPMPKVATEKQIGGHDVTFFGYDDSTKMFKFRNHWVNPDGTPWGDHGNGYFPYDYAVSSMASDFWVINAVPAAKKATTTDSVSVRPGFSGTLTFENGTLISAEPASG